MSCEIAWEGSEKVGLLFLVGWFGGRVRRRRRRRRRRTTTRTTRRGREDRAGGSYIFQDRHFLPRVERERVEGGLIGNVV
jgi:hypothetical protein